MPIVKTEKIWVLPQKNIPPLKEITEEYPSPTNREVNQNNAKNFDIKKIHKLNKFISKNKFNLCINIDILIS
jgi:hypothetical protein